MTKRKNKKIPTKNYIILICMFVGVFLLVYYLYSWYVVYSDYQKDIPVLKDTLTEIGTVEMEHYIQENSTSVIYLCTASSNDCRSFEKNFKKLIEAKALEQSIIYVNLNDLDINNFTSDFNNRYKYKKVLKNNYPALIVFNDGMIVDMLQGSNEKKLTIKRVEDFLEDNNIGEVYE